MKSLIAPVQIVPEQHVANDGLFTITPVSELIRAFPTTRYYGSKRKLLPWLFDCLKSVPFNTALDAFGGTGSVSQLFRSMRKSVSYHDAFEFNAHVARATLASNWTLDQYTLSAFLASVVPTVGTIATHFKGIFYLEDENRWLDGFQVALANSSLAPADKSVLQHLVFQACLKKRPFNLFHRANLAIRTQVGVERSFGNAVTWERTFPDLIEQSFGELRSLHAHRLPDANVLPSGDVANLEGGYDLVYLDPPYVSGRDQHDRDDYWRRYHFLEGLAAYDSWGSRMDQTSSIRLMKPPPHFGAWSRKATSRELLFSLVEKHRQSVVALSYVKNAYPEDVDILNHFESIFSRVTVYSTEHSHALSGRRRRELLFVGYP